MAGISGQTVVIFIGAALATVGIAFILYWKLLGERRLRQQPVPLPAEPRREIRERGVTVNGRVAEELR